MFDLFVPYLIGVAMGLEPGGAADTDMAVVPATEEVAGAVHFLLSPSAGYITGAVLRVNGGLYM